MEPAARAWPLRPTTALAWLGIVLTVAFVLWRNDAHSREGGHGSAGRHLALRVQARTLVGLASLNWPGASPAQLYDQAKAAFQDGDYGERLRRAVLAGELAGPAEALAGLRRMGRLLGAPPGEVPEEALRDLLERLYESRAKRPGGPLPLDDGERATLRDGLGWFGELALAPADGPDAEARARVLAPARRAIIGLLALLNLGGLALLAGLVLLPLAGVFWAQGRLGAGLDPARGGPSAGGVYAEAFALYLLLYLGLGLATRFLPRPSGDRLWLNLGLMAVSFAALAWPVVRGVPWRAIRHDVGLGTGKGVVWEVLAGVAGYLAALPVLGVAFFVFLGLNALQKRFYGGPDPSHPIVEEVLQGGWVWLEVYLLAAVGAPLIEETMFRGLLYRHLREGTDRWRRAWGVAASALFSGFVFAVIHPQGLVAVPLLMTLGAAFALLREWRGSLVPSMAAHALHNGTFVTLLWVMAG